MKKRLRFCLSLICVMALPLQAAEPADPLVADFINPPAATQPRCYWYWMKGQISKDGLTKDLEAMKRVGIGEAYIGVIYGGATKALTEEWWSMIDHAVREGTRLGVDIGLFNCPGWSQSGGPWVKPEQAMRYIVQSEKRVRGPATFAEKLPAHPKAVQELAVLAFPAPTQDNDTAEAQGAIITRAPKEIKLALPKPFTARSLTLQPKQAINVTATLEASDDGVAYRTVRAFPLNRSNLKEQVGPVPLAPVYIAFPPSPAAFFRVVFNKDCDPGELTLSAAPRLEALAEKSLIKMFQGPQPPLDFYRWTMQAEADSTSLSLQPATVLNLSAKLAADGTLTWQVPPGDWIIVRSGLAPTGVKNTPAPTEATGLEIDKMNRTALKSHFDAYVGKLLARIPAAQRTSWKHVVADSYEVGSQNWTDGLQLEFQQRYGYDPLVFLPVMTGRIVGSPAQSDRFLWDLRRLIADRISTEYVGGLRDLCNANGLKMWLENYGHWGFPGEFLQYGGNCDEIGGEFWEAGNLGLVELRPASSAAHIYGKKQVFAEAFTGGPRFTSTPWSLKKRGDWAYCQGINQFVLHVYIHQPWDDRLPGVNTWFGTEFNRHNTWFEASKSWIDYNRRCSVLLQQGQPVADVAYFIGEDAPRAFGGRNPELPPGYDFDYINAEVLLTRATAKDGRLVLASGMSYKLLVLPAQDTMTPELLEKIAQLAKAGVAVCGPRPVRSPSLKNFPACDQRVQSLAAELWDKGLIPPSGDLKAILTKIQTPPDLGGVDFEKILFTHRRTADADFYFLSNQTDAPVDLTPSFRVTGRAPELWNPDSGTREKLALYEVGATATQVPLRLEARGSVFVVFRGKAAADSIVAVKRDGLPYFLGGTDVVLGDDGKRVVQTRQPGRYELTTAQGKTQVATVMAPAAPQVIESGWQVSFPGQAAPVPFIKLASWTEHADPAVKYFSGTATYRTSFASPGVKTGERLTLDLGRVESLAEVTLNGRTFQWLWQPPYRLDITEMIKAGTNALEVRVVNTWHNRLSGQKHEPAAFSAPGVFKPWLADDYTPVKDLKPAGLLGPVTLLPTASAREL